MHDPVTRRLWRIALWGGLMLLAMAWAVASAQPVRAQGLLGGDEDGLSVHFGRFDCRKTSEGVVKACWLDVDAELEAPSWVNQDVDVRCEISIEAIKQGDSWGRELIAESGERVWVRDGRARARFAAEMDFPRWEGPIVAADFTDAFCWVE